MCRKNSECRFSSMIRGSSVQGVKWVIFDGSSVRLWLVVIWMVCLEVIYLVKMGFNCRHRFEPAIRGPSSVVNLGRVSVYQA